MGGPGLTRPFGLVAVGALLAVHLGTCCPAGRAALRGAVTAVVAVLVGLPALRLPGLFLAVTTLAFAILMQSAVLATPCITVPASQDAVHRASLPGLHLLNRPTLFGSASLRSARSPGSPSPSFSCRSSWCGCGATKAWPAGWWPCGTTRSGRPPWASRSCAPSCSPSACRASSPATPGCASPCHPVVQQHRHHLRPDHLVRGHLHGGHRRPGLHPGRHSRRLSRGLPPSSAVTRPSSSSLADSACWPSSCTCPAGGRAVAPLR